MTRRCRACGEVSSVDYRCEYCGADLVDQEPDHSQKRDRDRELRADGGADTDAAAYLNEEIELRIRGKRVHVQALVSILSTASTQLQVAGLDPAAALAHAVAEDAISLDETTNNFASMVATRGDGWRTDDPTDALDVDLVSIATDGGQSQAVVADDQIEETIYVASRRRRGGKPSAHTDRDCPALARASKVLEKSPEHTAHLPECRVCEGYDHHVPGDGGSKELRNTLLEADPEDLGLSPLGERPGQNSREFRVDDGTSESDANHAGAAADPENSTRSGGGQR